MLELKKNDIPSSKHVLKRWETQTIADLEKASLENKPLISVHQDHRIIPAVPADINTVIEFYLHHEVPGHTVRSIEVIENPILIKGFEAQVHILQNRAGKSAFAPPHSDRAVPGRKSIIDYFTALTLSHQEPTYPDVKFLPTWHGTNSEIIGSLFETGYANLATTDEGFFGKAIYSAYEAEYAYRVYSKGALILNWVAIFSPYPVLKHDRKNLEGKANRGNYDAHFIPVVSDKSDHPCNKIGINYEACEADQIPVYTEVAIFQTAACLPRYLVTLEKCGPLNELSLILSPLENYSQGMAYKNGWGVEKDLKKAFLLLEQAAEQGFSLALYEMGWCYREGEGILKDQHQAFKYYEKAAKKGLAKAAHELGWCYKKGIGVNQNDTLASKYFSNAALKGWLPAVYDLGLQYRDGQGVEKDRDNAMACLKICAYKGMTRAQYEMGNLYFKGKKEDRNLAEARKYYLLAHKQDYKPATLELETIDALRSTEMNSPRKEDTPQKKPTTPTFKSSVPHGFFSSPKKSPQTPPKTKIPFEEPKDKCLMM